VALKKGKYDMTDDAPMIPNLLPSLPEDLLNVEHDRYHQHRLLRLWIWERNRDFCGGVDRVKSRGRRYLAKDNSMTCEEDYKNHLMLTEMFPAARRTLQSHMGLIFRKPPTIANRRRWKARMHRRRLVAGAPVQVGRARIHADQ
jgi:hypothetical protein